MSQALIETGRWGEDLGCLYLQRRGYTIVARNVRTRWGEIDCVARHGRDLYIVEIKTRRHDGAGTALEQIGYHKQQRLIRLAQYYCLRHCPQNLQPHIAFLAIDGDATHYRIQWLPDAIEVNG